MKIVGHASPDGPYKLNQRLAAERADNLAAYLRSQIAIPESLMHIQSMGIDWAGLDRAVGQSSLMNKARVQYIIRYEPEFTYNDKGRVVRSRKQQLMNLDGGRTWRWLMDNIYPRLRSSASVVCYLERQPQPEPTTEPSEFSESTIEASELTIDASESTIEVSEPATEPAEAPIPASFATETLKYSIFALRTNLLLPLLNVGAELPIGNRWSVGVDYYYPWSWRKADHKNCFELIFISAEARYWFGKKHTACPKNRVNRLQGHSVGVYGAWGYYDIERNFHGHQGHGYSAGVDYLFALPIAKGRLHLEFQAAVGAMYTPAQAYNVKEVGGHLIRERGKIKKITYFGPTKVAVSLVVPLFRSEKRIIPSIEP